MDRKPIPTDALVLGQTYLVVPREGLTVRKTPRVSLAEDGEVLALDTHWVRQAHFGDVAIYAAPVTVDAPTEEPAQEALDPAPAPASETAPEEEPITAAPKRARSRE